eukprot:11439752-Heterocapsa_arctica.AAC.1
MKDNLDSPLLSVTEHALYRRFFGKAMYATQVRPDIAYTVKELARHVAGPSQQNMTAMKHFL